MRLTLSLILLTLLTACASSTRQAEPKRLLLRYDGPVNAAPATPRPRLVVRAVSIPDYLDRRELAQRLGAHEVKAMAGAVWAERPSKSITRWIAQALAAQRSDASIEAYSTADGRAPDAVLALTLEGFEPGVDGLVHLRGSYVYALQGKTASVTGRFDADAAQAATTPETSVAALQEALAIAVKLLAATLPPLAMTTAANAGK